MRVNIDLDTDAHTFATVYANARGLSLGAAISELIKRAEQAPEPPSGLLVKNKRGLLVRAKRGSNVITNEMVKVLSEDDLN
jgi:hypothetical protein